MGFKYYKTFEEDSISDGDTYEDTWEATEDLIIKRIHIINKSGAGFTDSTFYFKIADRVYTREVVPAVVLGPDVETTPELNIPIYKGEKLSFTFKNLEGSTVSVYITLEVWTP